ncbi:MAG: cyclic lactone autoinducer peptide [Oscillospiraceae bacterium]|nr:cyclic lactone autoinducer peptide [Oscillospiraceae bacterium]
MLIKLSSLTLLVAMIASKVPCWGINYQPDTPKCVR